MTKKHFIAIAAIIKQAQHLSNVGKIDVAVDLADYFATINPLFDHDRFIKAATVGDKA